MGLDITAYSKATLTDPHPQTDECWDIDHQWAFAYKGFERSLRGLVAERCYDTDGAQMHSFRAGSYGGYNHWRARLCQTFLCVDPGAVWSNPDAFADLPFFELINFADNEGTIGPEAAADLLADFEAGRDRWVKVTAGDADDDDLHLYDDWTLAFRLASAGGLVEFQ